jgi:hypothetical protein
VSFWSPLWASRLTRDARQPGGRVAVALGGPAWSDGVGLSCAVTHRHAEDQPVAKTGKFGGLLA